MCSLHVTSMWKTSEWKCHHENRDQTEKKQWKFREMKKKVRKKLNALGMVVGGRVRESGHLMLVSTIFVQVHFARVIISTFLCENARVIFFSLVPLSSVHECMNMFCFRHFWAVETLPANTLWNKAELKKTEPVSYSFILVLWMMWWSLSLGMFHAQYLLFENAWFAG